MKISMIAGLVIGLGSISLMQAEPRWSDSKIKAFAQEVRTAPGWVTASAADFKSQGRDLLRVLAKVKEADAESVRKILENVGGDATGDRINTWSKLYILNRLYCNVPPVANAADFRPFGGWVGVPVRDGQVEMLFPLKENSDCSFELASTYGGYMGPAYQYLSEFDFLLKRYGKRK